MAVTLAVCPLEIVPPAPVTFVIENNVFNGSEKIGAIVTLEAGIVNWLFVTVTLALLSSFTFHATYVCAGLVGEPARVMVCPIVAAVFTPVASPPATLTVYVPPVAAPCVIV